MKKDSIIQFVCFITELEPESFTSSWDAYAKVCGNDKHAILLHRNSKGKTKYRYVSQHSCDEQTFKFAFMKGRVSEHFPDHKVKVVQTGGYQPLQIQYKLADSNDETIVAFVDHNGPMLDTFKEFTSYTHLNIYQAYYESCVYGYILQFNAKEEDTAEVIRQIKDTGTDVGCYKECLVNA